MSVVDGPDGWIVSVPKNVTTEKELEDTWIVKVPTKMMVEPPAPKSPPVPSRWDKFCMALVTPMSLLSTLNQLRTNPKVVDKTPLVAVGLLEAANIQQLYQMWVVSHTAAGQSLTGWMTVNVALWLWTNFYLVFNRENKYAIAGTALGILMNSLVILTIVYFRYITHAG